MPILAIKSAIICPISYSFTATYDHSISRSDHKSIRYFQTLTNWGPLIWFMRSWWCFLWQWIHLPLKVKCITLRWRIYLWKFTISNDLTFLQRNIVKGTTNQRVEFCHQSNNFSFKISTKLLSTCFSASKSAAEIFGSGPPPQSRNVLVFAFVFLMLSSGCYLKNPLDFRKQTAPV